MKMATATSRSMKIATMVTRGPIDSKSWPMSQGRVILPRLPPTKNQPVTWPVMDVRRSASERVVGKIEASEAPMPSVPPRAPPANRARAK